MNYHVAFIQQEPLNRVLSGIKKAEIRMGINRPEAWKVEAGDLLLFKASGGNIVAAAEVKDVSRFEGLTPEEIRSLAELVAPLIGTSRSTYFEQKLDARYAVIIEFDTPHPIKFPSALTPRGVQSGWVSNFQWGYLAKCLLSAELPTQPSLI